MTSACNTLNAPLAGLTTKLPQMTFPGSCTLVIYTVQNISSRPLSFYPAIRKLLATDFHALSWSQQMMSKECMHASAAREALTALGAQMALVASLATI
eukprot:1158140-Pelagomonas_calceolata.AAC.8